METYTPSETSLVTLNYTADRQNNAYQCDPSSLKMAFSVYGLNVDEDWLASKAGTTSTNGTTVANMVSVISTVNSAYNVSLKGKSEAFDSWETLEDTWSKVIQ